MGDGIDNSFADHIGWDLVPDRRLTAFRPSPDTAVELGKDKVNGIIHLLEERPLEDSVKRRWSLNLGAMEMHAPDFGGREEPLRITTKQEQCRIGRLDTGEQVQMRQKVRHECGFRQWKLPRPGGPSAQNR